MSTTKPTKLAALIFSSISIPGDERSRTNPGHGYPAHEQPTIEIRDFKDQEEMVEWVKHEETQTYGKKKFKLIEYRELTYTIEAKVKLT